MKIAHLLLVMTMLGSAMAQSPQSPDVNAQRAAMKKLGFLVGRWSGEARILHGQGPAAELIQTEEAQYKLDGAILTIEGAGRSKADGKLALQALGIISYDDQASVYRMRAYNDGRWLETEIQLTEDGSGLTWGFAFGEIRTNSILRINSKGEWTESTELTIGSQPPRKFMELTVRRQK
jgi:hypothetical protein